MPKIVDKVQVQEDIIKAALLAFVKYGFQNTSMQSIAKEAGLAKGTLYLYFNSKEELTQAIAHAHFSRMRTILIRNELFNTLDELLENIHQILDVSNEQSQFIPIFFEIFGAQFVNKNFSKYISDFFDDWGEYFHKNFAHLMELNEIRNIEDPKALSRIFVSMLDGIILHKGFFQTQDKLYKQQINESIIFFKIALCPKNCGAPKSKPPPPKLFIKLGSI